MNRDQKIRELVDKLPESAVFPPHIRELLLNALPDTTDKQLDFLLKILEEEKRRLEAL